MIGKESGNLLHICSANENVTNGNIVKLVSLSDQDAIIPEIIAISFFALPRRYTGQRRRDLFTYGGEETTSFTRQTFIGKLYRKEYRFENKRQPGIKVRSDRQNRMTMTVSRA